MQRNIIISFSFPENVGYESVVKLIYHNYSFFKCAVDKIYLTAVNTVSNSAACSSPTDVPQIIYNDSLLSTNYFS